MVDIKTYQVTFSKYQLFDISCVNIFKCGLLLTRQLKVFHSYILPLVTIEGEKAC